MPLTSTSTPLATVATSATYPYIAIDSHGTIAVVSDGSVKIYAAPLTNSSTPAATFPGKGQPAFDTGGNLYVPDLAYVNRYSPPFSNHSVAFAVARGQGSFSAVAFDHSGMLYVIDPQSGLITVFAPPYTAAPAFSINTYDRPGLDCGYVSDLASDAAGSLYASSTMVDCGIGGVLQFSAPLSGTTTSLLTIAKAPRAVFQGAYSVAFDATGRLYIANNYLAGPSITGNSWNVAVFVPPFTAASVPASVSTVLPFTISSIAIGP